MRQRKFGAGIVAAVMVLSCGIVVGASSASQSHAVVHSATGSLNVLAVGGEWPSLDPAKDNEDALDATELGAIYGGLFEFGPKGQIIPDLAQSYNWAANNTEVLIHLRPNVTFTDGSPLTAAVVVANIQRDLLPANGCICDADFLSMKSISASGALTVILHMSIPFAPIIEAFQNTAPDWPVSTKSLNSEGESKFAFSPVGAGPYEVVSASENATITLKANPNYWDKGFPKIENLKFTPIGTDQSAFASLQTGQSQVVDGVTTIPLIKQQKSAAKFQVITQPAEFYEFVSLNQKIPPFSNKNARLAIYEATDSAALVKDVYGGLFTQDESPTAPGETFYEPTVPGYPTYNPTKAKALVSSLGGLTVTLATTLNTPFWTNEVTALEGEWEAVGIKVKLSINTLGETLTQLQSGSWQALDSNWGGSDPTIALPTYFGSKGPFSGVHDTTLDNLFNEGATIGKTTAQRGAIYDQIAARMAANADVPFIYSKPFFIFAAKSVSGIPSDNFNTYWEYVSIS